MQNCQAEGVLNDFTRWIVDSWSRLDPERGERRAARAGREHGGAIASARRSWAIRRSSAPNSKLRTFRASGHHRDSPSTQKRRRGGLGEGVRRETAGRWLPVQVRRRGESSRDRERVQRGARQLLYLVTKLGMCLRVRIEHPGAKTMAD